MIVNQARVAAALPGYDLGTELGNGAQGLVLAGRHRRLNRDVAVKVLDVGHDDGAVARFAAEAQVLATMDHPHIVRVYDYVEDDDLCLIVMEMLPGGTLTRRRARLRPEGPCAVGLAIAAALSYAHTRRVLHRDIKSGNVLFDAAGLLKVTDFGIAKVIEGAAATASAVVGTPGHMAPEQILGGRLGPTTDLYALGVVLYHLLSGAPPFDPKLPQPTLLQRHLDTTPAPPAGVPAPVADVVMRSLAKDPAERQPSAHAFALDLARAARDTYGPQWAARSGVVLRLDDDIREAATSPATATRRASAPDPPVARPAARRRPHRDGLNGDGDLDLFGRILVTVIAGLGFAVGTVFGTVAAAVVAIPELACLVAALLLGLGLGLGVGAAVGAAVSIPIGVAGFIFAVARWRS